MTGKDKATAEPFRQDTGLMADWQDNILEDDERILNLVENSRRIAVLGIRPESPSAKPAFTVPQVLQKKGYEIVPVPVYFPEIETILGERVYRRLPDIPGEIDIVDVFRKPADIPAHVPDMLETRPRAVWFQLGIRNDDAARELAMAGILVVQNRCLKIEALRIPDPSHWKGKG